MRRKAAAILAALMLLSVFGTNVSVYADDISSDTAAADDIVLAEDGGLPDDPEYWKYMQQEEKAAEAAEGGLSVFRSSKALGEGYTHDERFANATIHHGIDVSYYQNQQGTIDWNAVKQSGVEFVFVRVGYRGYAPAGNLAPDPKAAENLQGAINAGLRVGAYIFSQATSEAEAVAEAQYALQQVAGYNITMPIVMDYEYAYYSNGNPGRLAAAGLSSSQHTAIVNAFGAAVESAGYDAMIYANKTMLENSLNAGDIRYKVWLARYPQSSPYAAGYSGDYEYWQYTSSGYVSGVSGRVDCNFWYELNTYSQTVSDGVYTIETALDSGMALDIENGSRENSANLQLLGKNAASRQDFKVTYVGDGKYTIMAMCSGKYLDAEGGGRTEGTNVLQYSQNSGDNQKWYIQDAGDGSYYIRSAVSEMCLDVSNGTATNGANILLWNYNGGTNQRFRFRNTQYTQTVADGLYVISAESDANLVWDVSDASNENAANIGIWEQKNENNQKFYITHTGNGQYTIAAKHSGKYVDAENGGGSAGANVLQYDNNGATNQRWYLKDAGNGSYYIVSAASGLYVDVANSLSMGNNIQLWNPTAGTNQRFCLTLVNDSNENTSSDGTLNGWYVENGKKYWYDNGVMARDKEVYDPGTDAWYWFDADGTMATNKDVFIPTNAERTEGKWVRYDANGGMVKGEDYRYGGWYWFDPTTGEMIKGFVFIPEEGTEGKWVYYDDINGQMHHGESCINGNWYYFDDWTGKMVHGEYCRNGNWYYYDQNTGIMAHGWVTLPNGTSVYYDDVTGVRA